METQLINVYKNRSGVERLADSVSGLERIHVGIRPFGLHAGNIVSLVGYPWMLCREADRRGVTPRFRIMVSINDWEQHKPSGVDPVRYPYNIVPQHTTFQYTSHSEGGSLVDHWQPRIESAFGGLRKAYPHIQVEFHRNSALKSQAQIPDILRATLSSGRDIAELLAKQGQYEVLVNDDVLFASAVCPQCYYARGETEFRGTQSVSFRCVVCGHATRQPWHAFDYWWHHKPLFIARWFAWDFDIAISGGDHRVDNDSVIRDEVRAILGMPPKRLSMLFAPLVTDAEGIKMSKSAFNEAHIDVETALRVCESSDDDVIPITAFGEK